jgi:putative protease
MKSAEYVGNVVAAYRYVIDHWQEDKKGVVAAGKRMLSADFARSKTSYWYGFNSNKDAQEQVSSKILNPNQAGGTGIYLGKISATKPASKELIEAVRKNSSNDEDNNSNMIQLATLTGGAYDPDPGDSIRLHKKDDTGRESHKVRSVEIAEDGRRWLDIPTGFSMGDSVYLLQNMKRTGVLIECGFLSNPEEEAKLRNKTYQQKLCAVIVSSLSAFINA